MVKPQRVYVDVKQPDYFIRQVKNIYPQAVAKNLGDHLGDIFVGLEDRDIRIEVKSSPNDYVASITDKRLFTQAEGMRKATRWAFLLHPEFSYGEHDRVISRWKEGYGEHSHWHRNHIEGSLTRVQSIGVMTRSAWSGYMDGILNIVSWAADADEGSVSREQITLSPFDEYDQSAVNLLVYFDGIGIKQAKNFLKWAGKRPLYEYWALATTPFLHDNHPVGWSNNTIERNRLQLGYPPTPKPKRTEWVEELDI